MIFASSIKLSVAVRKSGILILSEVRNHALRKTDYFVNFHAVCTQIAGDAVTLLQFCMYFAISSIARSLPNLILGES